jgi:outer membrane protein insertion porin family
MRRLLSFALCVGVSWASAAWAAPAAQTAAPQPAGAAPAVAAQAPANRVADRQPPAGTAPVTRAIELRFPRQGDVSVVEPQTYLYYIQTRPSRPSEDVWVPYDEQSVLDDFRRLWNTNFLDDLWIEVNDVPYPNGVVGKHIIFNMEERQRIKIVEYVGTKVLEQTKIDEQLKERALTIRLDSFIDPGMINRVKSVIREMLAEKGHLDGQVTHELRDVAGGPKLVNLTFTIQEGPKYKIRDIEFVGNQAVGDGTLARRMKENKEQWFLSFITGRGTYQQNKFEEDAEKIIEYYRDRGYIAARVGQPEVRTLEDSTDGETRYVQLRVPVTEGPRYRLGTFAFDGNSVVNSEILRPLFKVKEGEFYEEKKIRDGLTKARELYGAGGYFEFTGFPDLQPRDKPNEDEEALQATPRTAGGPPIVDVTMRMQEGKQYFVNRITFVGNTTTRDHVIRREIRLFEGAPFNTEALKFSVRRLNQLGYFKNLEDSAIQVDKTPNEEAQVDVTLKLEEQNRNQLTFGAGVSQFEGFFGQLSFQTANFMGRGETLTLALQAGSRSQNYQIAFTEPFLFDRPITGGFDIYKREVQYPFQFTQASSGGNIQFGFPLADFTRTFVGYSFEQVRVEDLNPLYNDPAVISRNPFLADALLIGQGGRRTISKITPSVVMNTIDNPMFPTTGRRYTASFELAGLGGNTNFLKPRVEGIWYLRHTARTSLAFRGLLEYVRPYGSTDALPIFERLFLGGEYSLRGYDIRTIGPRDPGSGLVIGGNKSVVLNAEYLISIAGPVRLVLFYDAGQVRDIGERFALKEDITQVINPPPPLLYDPFATVGLSSPDAPGPETVTVGRRTAFKTSTGAEIRFFMPVLNVPFRLIFAFNPQRGGVLDNNLEPAKDFTFRFAVGSTF